MADVREWLDSLGLSQYAEAFDAGAIDWEVLPDLDHEILKEIGVTPPGHRLRILKAASSLLDPTKRVSAPEIGKTRPESLGSGEAERRQLTVMFADLVGSTELSRNLDPEDLRKINRLYQDAAKAAIEQCGGYVARYMGDGVLAYFGYPQAHEDDAERALRAGLTLTETVPTLNPDVALAVRVGIATGPVVVGDLIGEGAAQESAVVGETPNLAARLQGAAEPNTVVISEATKALTVGLFEMDVLPAQDLKGFAGGVTSFRVGAEARGQSRFAARTAASHLSPFVGREEELELLIRRWSRAREGRGQVVLAVGEPGIGKSRLLRQLQVEIDTTRHEAIFLQCSPYHEATALYPPIAAFERVLGLAEQPADASHLEALKRHLEQVDETDESTLGLLAHLLSIPGDGRFPQVEAMDGGQRRERTLQALLSYIGRLAARAPLLCVFEDVHWADPSTRELLRRMVESVESTPALVIATARPGFESGWTDLAHVQVMNLSRLGPEAASELLTVDSRVAAWPHEVVDAVLHRAEGNPLFIEELARTVLESSERFADGDVIPATLHDSLMARLDASKPGKAVAQYAAVIGRVFGHSMLREVWEESPEKLAEGLNALEASGLVSSHGEGTLTQYVFKHALVRDAAYGSLLRERRSKIHGRAAAALEATAEHGVESIAYHYEAAGEGPKAAFFLVQAAAKAAANYAHREAIELLRRALVQAEVGSEPLDEMCTPSSIVLRTAQSWYFLGEFGTSMQLLDKEAPRMRPDSEPAIAGEWYFWLAHGFTRTERVSDTAKAAERSIDLAGRVGDLATIGKAHGILVFDAGQKADVATGEMHAAASVDALEKTGDVYWLGMTHYYRAFLGRNSSRFQDALFNARRAEALGREIENPRLITYGLFGQGEVLAFGGQGEQALEFYQEALRMAPDPSSKGNASGGYGWGLYLAGEYARALPVLREGIEFWSPWPYGRISCRLFVSEALLCLNEDPEAEAKELARNALAEARRYNFRFLAAWCLRVLGSIALRTGQQSQAVELTSESIMEFEQIGSLRELSRTHASLANVYRASGNEGAAEQHARKADSIKWQSIAE